MLGSALAAAYMRTKNLGRNLLVFRGNVCDGVLFAIIAPLVFGRRWTKHS